MLSYQDVINSNYGFSSDYSDYDTARQKKTTDYAQAQGAQTSTSSGYAGNGGWRLRSPDYSVSYYALRVCDTGYAHGFIEVNEALFGVVPALQIRLDFVEPDDEPIDELAYTRNGNKITFGSYPQSEVTDSSLTATLNSKAGRLPTSSNSQAWTYYRDYYISSSEGRFMWYIDVEEGGEKYRGVYFTSYRPCYTMYSSSTDNTDQDDNGYTTSTVYWFKYEPISWTILSEDMANGTALILCDMIIDSQAYHNKYSSSACTNNYARSTILRWLNATFYNTAFSALQKCIILTTTVDNSAATTSSSSNQYACENTQDKVFLLSYQDVINSNYGFSSDYSDYDTARQKKTTDYAQVQGAYTSTSSGYAGNGYWWLRSPNPTSKNAASVVLGSGSVKYYYDVYNITFGVVPALQILL